jgi:hypothetical protein
MCESEMVITGNEEDRFTELVERLKTSYPDLSDDIVAKVVDNGRDAFAGSRIREFVPLFVERRARNALAELSV